MIGANESLNPTQAGSIVKEPKKKEVTDCLILPRLFSLDKRQQKCVEHPLPCAFVGHICYVNTEQEIFAIQLNHAAAKELIEKVHDHFSATPMGKSFSAKPTIDTSPPRFKVGSFAAAYINELRHVCRVEMLNVNKKKQEAEVLAIDIGAIAVVPFCLLFALPPKFSDGPYRTALALVCRLVFSKDSKFLMIKDLWYGLNLLVFVLSKSPPHMVLATEVGDHSFVKCLLDGLPKIYATRLQNALNELNVWAEINRQNHNRRRTYAPTPWSSKKVYVATVVSVTSIKAIHVRDFESGVFLVMLTECIRRRYSNPNFCAKMSLLENEICPGLGVVFYNDSSFYRGVIRNKLPNGQVWIDCLDYSDTFYLVSLDTVFHPSYELLQVGGLVCTIDLSFDLSPYQIAEKSILAARILEPGMVVNISHDGEQTYITLPNNTDLHTLLGLPRETLTCTTVWSPESSASLS